MTFLELQERVAELAGLDNTNTSDNTRIVEWINQSYQQLSAIYDWPWLIDRTIIQTQADINTGTLSVTNNSTAVTFSAAPTIVGEAEQYMIQIDGTEEWYNLTDITTTSGTLSVPYLGTTDATAGYKLRKMYYSLPTGVDRVLSMQQTIDDIKLEEISTNNFHEFFVDPNQTDTPRSYYFNGTDTSNQYQVGFYPIPATSNNIHVQTYKKITELSAQTDEPIFPVKFHNVLVFSALFLYGYDFIDDDRIAMAQSKTKQLVEQMIMHINPGTDLDLIIRPWDAQGHTKHFRNFRLPGKFGKSF